MQRAPHLILPQLAENGQARIDRFWAKVERRGADDCWIWKGSLTEKDYGRFYAGSSNVAAHRFAWVVTHDLDPMLGQVVMHTCDNPPCCNPAHLRLGTYLDNTRDMQAKRRDRSWGRAPSLSADQVLAVVADERPHGTIAADYGVSKSVVHDIKLGRRRSSVTGIVYTPSRHLPKCPDRFHRIVTRGLKRLPSLTPERAREIALLAIAAHFAPITKKAA